MPEQFYDQWIVVGRDNKSGETKVYRVNTRQTDPAKVAENFNASQKHPHLPVSIEAVDVYPVTAASERIEGAAVWKGGDGIQKIPADGSEMQALPPAPPPVPVDLTERSSF